MNFWCKRHYYRVNKATGCLTISHQNRHFLRLRAEPQFTYHTNFQNRFFFLSLVGNFFQGCQFQSNLFYEWTHCKWVQRRAHNEIPSRNALGFLMNSYKAWKYALCLKRRKNLEFEIPGSTCLKYLRLAAEKCNRPLKNSQKNIRPPTEFFKAFDRLF